MAQQSSHILHYQPNKASLSTLVMCCLTHDTECGPDEVHMKCTNMLAVGAISLTLQYRLERPFALDASNREKFD